MKSKFILDLDQTVSIEANLEFLDKVERELKARRKALTRLLKLKPDNQLDIEIEASKNEH